MPTSPCLQPPYPLEPKADEPRNLAYESKHWKTRPVGSGSVALAGKRPAEVHAVRHLGVPMRQRVRLRTEDPDEGRAQGGRFLARSPADANDLPRAVFTGWPDCQSLRALARGTIADPLRARLPEPKRQTRAIRTAIAVVGDD